MSKKKILSYRSRLLIYPRFQLTLLGAQLVITIAALLAVITLTEGSYSYLKQQGMMLGVPLQQPYFQFLDAHAKLVYRYLALALALSFVVSCLSSLLISQRLTGPIYRLRQYFKAVANGEKVEPIHFRKGDFFSDLPNLVNQAFERTKRGS